MKSKIKLITVFVILALAWAALEFVDSQTKEPYQTNSTSDVH